LGIRIIQRKAEHPHPPRRTKSPHPCRRCIPVYRCMYLYLHLYLARMNTLEDIAQQPARFVGCSHVQVFKQKFTACSGHRMRSLFRRPWICLPRFRLGRRADTQGFPCWRFSAVARSLRSLGFLGPLGTLGLVQWQCPLGPLGSWVLWVP
jgi:hypothetical protein